MKKGSYENTNKGTFSRFHEDIVKNFRGTEEQNTLLRKALLKAKDQKINLMVTGGTGVGKSSTINALFDMKKAKVGVGADPETMEIAKYELDNLTIWDTPGLGDGKEKDVQHAKKIIDKLCEKDEQGYALIDLVLVIVDGSSRDMGTTYELINQVILKTLQQEGDNRILIALNKADEANGGNRGWDIKNNQPKESTKNFLKEKEESVRRRIKEATGVDVKVVSYKAGYTDRDTGETEKPWNLVALLDYIIEYTPKNKRIALAQYTNQDETMWEDNEDLEIHRKNIFSSLIEGIGGFIGDIFYGAMDTIDSVFDFFLG